MTYKRFEDLPVWQSAVKLAIAVYDFTEHELFARRFSQRDQLERAAQSVSNNIAEGFERGTTNEFINFLYIARGSCGEVRSMLCMFAQRAGFGDLKFEISSLQSLAEEVSRQLHGLITYLVNTDIKGPRHLTERERRKRNLRFQI